MRCTPRQNREERTPRNSAEFQHIRKRCLFQRWQNLRLPLAPPLVWILRVDALLRMDQPRFDLFQAVRFLADVFDVADVNVPPLQQSDRLPVARVPVRPSSSYPVKRVAGIGAREVQNETYINITLYIYR